jgi:hypothetical protein
MSRGRGWCYQQNLSERSLCKSESIVVQQKDGIAVETKYRGVFDDEFVLASRM